MSLARSALQYLGVRAINPPNLQLATRAPTSGDTSFLKGTLWLDTVAGTSYMWPGSGNWISLGSGMLGAIVTLTGNSGGAISPVGGNVDIVGGSGVTVTGTAGTLTIDLTGGGIAMDSFVPNAGTNPVVPSALGVVTMAGTANQITTTGGLNSLTFSTPSTFIAPGTIASTTTITSGTALISTTTLLVGTGATITTGGILVSGGDIINAHSNAATDVTIEVTNSDNTSGSSRSGVEIATGGASSGDPYLSFQISGVGASTMTMGLDNSASDLFVISNSSAIGTSNSLTLSQAGALTATTSLTATLGAITATNGNLVLGTAGNKILSSSVGASAAAGNNSFGKVTLIGGTITVSTTAVTASSIIMLTRQTVGATGAAALGMLTIGTIVAGTSFVINAWKTTDATDLAITDVSSIGWMIIN